MKQKLKKIFQHLRNPQRLKAYSGWILKKSRPFLPSFCLLLGVQTISILIGFASSFISKHVVDSATAGMDFLSAFILMIAVSVVTMLIGFLTSIATTLINERFSFGIRMKVFDHILDSSYLRLSRYHSGDLLTRLTSDVGTVANGIASAFPSIFLILFRLVAAFIILFSYTPGLALAALALGPVGLVMSVLLGDQLKKLSVEVKESESAYRSFMQENLANITVVKTFCAEDRSRERMAELRGRTLRATLKRAKLSMGMNLCIQTVFKLGYFIAFGYCLYGLFNKNITYGTMTLFLTLFSQIQQPVMSLAHLIPQCIGTLASAGRVMELEDVPCDSRSGMNTSAAQVGLKLTDVSFSYGRKPVFEHVSFRAEPGQLVGVMGPSGAGKTTLIRLVLSLMEPSAGTVEFCYDGTTEAASADSRRHIAYVPQGNSLLSGTIADNLRYGKSDATVEEMRNALQRAAADFVFTLPAGLDTELGEKSAGLSEGQAQRIAIARALLRRAPVLVLDEATSALDAAAEETVLRHLSAPDRDYAPLCLIITHRKTMIPYFDRLVEIDDAGVRFSDPRES